MTDEAVGGGIGWKPSYPIETESTSTQEPDAEGIGPNPQPEKE